MTRLIQNSRGITVIAACLAVLFLLPSSGAGKSDPGPIQIIDHNPDSHMHFKLAYSETYIETTVDDSSAGAGAMVEVLMWWDAGYAPSSPLEDIEVRLLYNDDELTFYSDSSTTHNWSGGNASMIETALAGQNEIFIHWDNGGLGDECQETETVYARLRFNAACQTTGSAQLLQLRGTQLCCAYIDNTKYYPEDEINNLEHGWLGIKNDYAAQFELSDVTDDCSLQGTYVEPYCYVTTNFRAHKIRHLMTYDADKLTYIGGMENGALFDGIFRVNMDTIEVTLDPAVSLDGYVPEQDNAMAYYLTFQARSDWDWDGHDGAAEVDLIADSCFVQANYFGDTCEYVAVYQSFDDAQIGMDEFATTLTLDTSCVDCRGTIMGPNDPAVVAVVMDHNYKAGGSTTETIRINVPFHPLLDLDGTIVDVENDGIEFMNRTDYDANSEQQYCQGYAYSSGTFTCNSSRQLYFMQFERSSQTMTSYDDRVVTLDIAPAVYPVSGPDTTLVSNAESDAVYEATDDVSVTGTAIEIPVVEFTTTSDISQSGQADGYLKIRNNFALTNLDLTISTDGDIEIDGYRTLYPNIAVTQVSDHQIHVYSTTGFGLADQDAAYTDLLRICYIPDGCGGCDQKYSYATISVSDASGTGISSPDIINNRGTISANCCGTAIYPGPCDDGGGPMKQAEEAAPGLPTQYALSQNHPNPFNPTTVIEYAVPEQTRVVIEVYNMLGQRVTELVNEEQAPGRYNVEWDASRLASGIYLYRMQAGNFVETRKMMLMK